MCTDRSQTLIQLFSEIPSVRYFHRENILIINIILVGDQEPYIESCKLEPFFVIEFTDICRVIRLIESVYGILLIRPSVIRLVFDRKFEYVIERKYLFSRSVKRYPSFEESANSASSILNVFVSLSLQASSTIE